jgi:hypothetical protein
MHHISKVATKRARQLANLDKKAQKHVPTEHSRLLVSFLSGIGVPVNATAAMLGIGHNTLRELYSAEQADGGAFAKAHIVKNAYEIAMDRRNPNHAAMTMFICKTQYKWHETDRHEQVLMGPDGTPADLKTVIILPSNGREMPLPALPTPERPRKDIN